MMSELLPKGFYRDRLLEADGNVIDRGWRGNLIVDRCRFLLAAFMRGDASTGIERLLIGRGSAVWDATPPEPAPRSTQQLEDPAPFEVVITSSEIDYLDAAGNPTTGPTNRIRITVELGENEPPGEDPFPLREFGLFGSFGGEAYMINYVRHGVIHKPADATLQRTISLIF